LPVRKSVILVYAFVVLSSQLPLFKDNDLNKNTAVYHGYFMMKSIISTAKYIRNEFKFKSAQELEKEV